MSLDVMCDICCWGGMVFSVLVPCIWLCVGVRCRKGVCMYVCVCVCMAYAYMWFGAPHILKQSSTQAPTPTKKQTINRRPRPHTHIPSMESNGPATPPTPTHCPTTHTHTHLHSGCVVVRYVGQDPFVCVGGWVGRWVFGLICAHGCVFVCGCVSMTSWVRGCACGCVGVGVTFATILCTYSFVYEDSIFVTRDT